jgi:uncharacterized coiled-coil DUF342 family protein
MNKNLSPEGGITPSSLLLSRRELKKLYSEKIKIIKTVNILVFNLYPLYNKLSKKLEQLEWYHQTTPLSAKEEDEIIKKIKELHQELAKIKEQIKELEQKVGVSGYANVLTYRIIISKELSKIKEQIKEQKRKRKEERERKRKEAIEKIKSGKFTIYDLKLAYSYSKEKNLFD